MFQALGMPADPALQKIEMADADTWMAIGAGGLAQRSIDGGDSWSPVAVGTGAALRDVVFFNFADPPSNQQTLHGVIVGDGMVLRSDDLAVLHSDGTISGWPESEMVAEPVLVGAGARVLSRGNASGALAVGDAGLAAFVMRTINEPCELPDEF